MDKSKMLPPQATGKSLIERLESNPKATFMILFNLMWPTGQEARNKSRVHSYCEK